MDRRDLFRTALALGLAAWATGCASGTPGGRVDVTLGVGPTLPEPPGSLFGRLGDALVSQLATDTENLALSPFSIGSALAMVRQGAAGGTASELDEVLGLDASTLAAAVNTTWQAMTGEEGVELDGANAIWAQRDHGWKQPYLDALAAFGAPLQERDIAGDPEGTRAQVNAWVKEVTHDKIPELLPPGLVTAMTRMVLVNALRFAGPWLRPLFDQGEAPFRAPGGTVQVPWLVGGGMGLPWVDGPDAAATVLPIRGGGFGLALVLPAEGTPVADVLTSQTLAALLRAETAPVSVGLPKFEVRTEAALADALAAIGVRDAFDPDRADFSPMTDRERLHIGFVQHQAVVAIDEKGIEAAAATAIGMEAGGSAGPPKQLTCDRPFGYALVHLATATPLFVGVVADPSA